MLIFKRSKYIVTASGIVTLRKQLFSGPVESGLTDSVRSQPVHWMESDDTRCCSNTIWPPENEHGIARNMSRIIT